MPPGAVPRPIPAYPAPPPLPAAAEPTLVPGGTPRHEPTAFEAAPSLTGPVPRASEPPALPAASNEPTVVPGMPFPAVLEPSRIPKEVAAPTLRPALPGDAAFARSSPPPLPPLAVKPTGPGWNLLARHWRGEYSLGWSYWGISVLLNLPVALTLALVSALLIHNGDGYDPRPIFFGLALSWTLAIAVSVWQFVGTWRSASRHAVNRRRMRKGTGWSIAAKVALILGALLGTLQFALHGVPQLYEMSRIAFLDDPGIPAYAFRAMRDDTEIELTGGFKFGMARDFTDRLARMPNLRVVHLNSDGGRVGEARKVFDMIREHGLVTYVSARCLSACTLAFVGGKERWLGPGAALGFHGPSFVGLRATALNGAKRNWREQYLKAGLDPAFVDRGLAVPSTEIWTPTPKELADAHVITAVATGREFAASGLGHTVTRDDLGKIFLNLIPAIGALRTVTPDAYDSIVDAALSAYLSGQPFTEVGGVVRSRLAPILIRDRGLADDEVVLETARIAVAQYRILGARNPTACYNHLVHGEVPADAFPPELIERELAIGARIVETAAARPEPTPVTLDRLRSGVRIGLMQRLPSRSIALLDATSVPPARHGEYCALMIATYDEILRMRPADAVTLLRAIYASK